MTTIEALRELIAATDAYTAYVFDKNDKEQPAFPVVCLRWRKAWDSARAALAAREAHPVVWVVFDEEGYPIYCANWREAAHEHVTSAVHQGLEGASKWLVRPFVEKDQTP